MFILDYKIRAMSIILYLLSRVKKKKNKDDIENYWKSAAFLLRNDLNRNKWFVGKGARRMIFLQWYVYFSCLEYTAVWKNTGVTKVCGKQRGSFCHNVIYLPSPSPATGVRVPKYEPIPPHKKRTSTIYAQA